MEQARADSPLRLAAVDLGSNSFHLLVVEVHNDRFVELEKCSRKVQLAAGLDDSGRLDDKATARALKCLDNFGNLLDENRVDRLRVVGTNALRTATNSVDFQRRAEQSLGQRIEIISGREEARLIYQGASRDWHDNPQHCLVVDIGGGSTELIVGSATTPLALESLDMGCVAYTRRFFTDDRLGEAPMDQAQRSALLELAAITTPYRQLGWQRAMGSSGTIKAAAAVIHAMNPHVEKGVITRAGLFELRRRLTAFEHLDQVSMSGLKSNRARVFPAGIAILCAVFEAFDIERMQHTDGALRDGVLLDLLERDTGRDVRYTTLVDLQKRLRVDTDQATRVTDTCLQFFDRMAESWQLEEDGRELIEQAALLHEIGLGVSHSRFQHHGAYLLANADMPGFSLPDQWALAWLVQAHRRDLPDAMPDHRAALEADQLLKMARLLRLAVVFHRRRDGVTPTLPVISAEGDRLILDFERAPDQLLADDLIQEQAWQQRGGLELVLRWP